MKKKLYISKDMSIELDGGHINNPKYLEQLQMSKDLSFNGICY